MPEHPTRAQFATLEKLRSEYKEACIQDPSGEETRAEELQAQIEAQIATLRDLLDPTAHAESILGPDVIGIRDIGAIEDGTGIKVFDVSAPTRSRFSREDLEQAKAHGEQLYYTPDRFTPEIAAKHSFPDTSITMQRLHTVFPKAKDGKKLLYDTDWYKNEEFFTKDAPRSGWRLTSKDVIPDSTSKNYLQQTDLLITHLKTVVYKDRTLPPEYAAAISEYEAKKNEIQTLMTGDRWKDASKILSELKITTLTRETPVDALYRLLLNSYTRNHKLLPSTYTWTSRRASDGSLVLVGDFGDDGASVRNDGPRFTLGYLGVCLSRM